MAGTDLVPVTQVIRGRQEHIQTVLRTAHSRGRLVTEPQLIRPLTLGGGLHEVTVEMLVPLSMLGRRKRLSRWSAKHEIASACLKALGFGLALSAAIGIPAVGLILFVTRNVNATDLGWVAVALLLFAATCRFAAGRGHSGHGKGWGFHWTKCE